MSEPIQCKRDDAWMGNAYYYWLEESDAIYWGMVSKSRNGRYAIYKSRIVSDDVLDTVFNEEHYSFWVKQIEKVAAKFHRLGKKPSLKQINQYFLDNLVWNDLDGILFQDISRNPVHFLVEDFQYKKRIQLAVFNKRIIFNFAIHFNSEA